MSCYTQEHFTDAEYIVSTYSISDYYEFYMPENAI